MGRTRQLTNTSPQKSRTRLSPEMRMEMILDHAAELIGTEGVSGINMERLGRKIGISKSLIYAYYPSVNDLLQALMKREYAHLRKLQIETAHSATTLEELVRGSTGTYLAYIEERGMLLSRLTAEPSIAVSNDPTGYNRQPAVDYLAQIVADTLGIDLATAEPAVDISFGLSSAAGQYLCSHDVSRKKIEDITVTMIIGAIEAIADKYTISFKPLVRSKKATAKKV